MTAPTEGTCQGYNGAQLMGAISAAIKAGDFEVPSLMLMLAVADPKSAAEIKGAIDLIGLIK